MGASARQNADRTSGPTSTLTLQDEYRREFSTRFRTLRGLVRTTVEENDALQLRERRNAEPAESFQFTTDARKQQAFRAWLQGALDDGVLEPADGRVVRQGNHYTGSYVRSAYRSGASKATSRLRSAGYPVEDPNLQLTFRRPIHRNTLEALFTRNYQQLDGITSHADQQLSRLLSEGLASGVGPRKVAGDLTGELRDIQRARARVLARTEILNAHNRAALNRYGEEGVERVRIIPHEPCAQCRAIVADGPYRIEDVPNPPFHPRCRCTVAPVIRA